MRRVAAIAIASAASLLGLFALAVEARISVAQSLGAGHGIVESIFLYLRFFTILTNGGLVLLQAATALRLLRRRQRSSAATYDAALVYALVTGITYELLLRGLWSPQDWRFVSDMILHDVAPVLMLATWILVPHRGAAWRDVPWMLVYPAGFLVLTLVAGAGGEGYPYDFLNVAELGLGRVLLVALAFLAVFLLLGMLVTGLARLRAARARRLAPCTSSS